jgi:predicted PurR-regulated permease PerM
MKKIAFLAVPLLPLLTACGGGNLGEEIKAKLIPSWVSFVVQFVALLVLLLIVFVFAYKPVKKILQKRSDYIEQQIKLYEEYLTRNNTTLSAIITSRLHTMLTNKYSNLIFLESISDGPSSLCWNSLSSPINNVTVMEIALQMLSGINLLKQLDSDSKIN